jgi:proteasome assembly chaperone (PAC2) family protein
MEGIKVLRQIELKSPVMIAGWPGMGSVAMGVVDYLQKALAAKKFAQIDIDPFASLDSVVIRDGHAKIPAAPQQAFYYSKDPDMIIFRGEAQIHAAAGIDLVRKVASFACQMGVSRIFTAAALPYPASYSETPRIYAASNRRAIVTILSKYGIQPMEEGHISGLNGLLVGFAEEKRLEAVCLLATMPQYAISLPNPKASAAIIETLSSIVHFKADMRPMEENIRQMDEKMALIEDRVKDVIVTEIKEKPEVKAAHKVPDYIIDKIEKLFREAVSDRTKGVILKKELDRWDLYGLYEDRFLDLFKDSQ